MACSIPTAPGRPELVLAASFDSTLSQFVLLFISLLYFDSPMIDLSTVEHFFAAI